MRFLRVVAGVLLGAWPVAAQQPDSVPETQRQLRYDARVRYRVSSDAPRVQGRVRAFYDDTVVVRVDRSQAETRVALRDLQSLEVHGKGRAGADAATFFGVVGFLAGATTYVSWCLRDPEECERREEELRTEEDDSAIPPIFGMMAFGGAILLGGIAYGLTPPHWEEVKLPVRIGILPMRRGVGLYARVAFE